MKSKPKKSKILIIEDDLNSLKVLTKVLKESGYNALIAEDGEMGIQRAIYTQPEMILLDILLPDIDGFEICRRLKASEQTKNIPVIFLTALGNTEDKLKGFRLGAVDYIVKPFRQEEVLARVNTHLRLQRLSDQLEQLVQERTVDLVKTNEQLHQEIIKRKQAEEQIKNHNVLLEQAVSENTKAMKKLTERLVRQEKLATIGQISGSIAHELRNPLGAIKQSVFYLNRLYTKGRMESTNLKVSQHLALIGDELETTQQVINSLLESTSAQPPIREQLDLQTIMVKAAQRLPLKHHLQLHFILKPDPFLILADPLQFRQVLVNVLTNAVQAAGVDALITVKARLLAAKKQLQIQIQDNGPGLDPETLSQVFEPLFTTKATGTGLGLSICKKIIKNHSGTLILHSHVGQGTVVEIVLPIISPVVF